MAANVSIDALMNVAAALNDFRIDMTYFSEKIYGSIGEAECQCRSVINDLKKKIEKLENDIRELENKVNECQCRISKRRLNIANLEGLISKLRSENSMYESKKRPLSSASDPEDYGRIEEQNSALDAKIASNNNLIYKYEKDLMIERTELQNAENELKETDRQFNELKAEKNKKDRLKIRLDGAYNRVESAMGNLRQTSKQFCRNALDETEGNISGINRCIQYAQEYASTNL